MDSLTELEKCYLDYLVDIDDLELKTEKVFLVSPEFYKKLRHDAKHETNSIYSTIETRTFRGIHIEVSFDARVDVLLTTNKGVTNDPPPTIRFNTD